MNADWLFECARTGTKVAEGPFIVDQNQSPEGEEQEEVYPVSEKTPISGPSRVLEKGGRNTELDQTSAAPGRGTKIEAELLENKENTKNPGRITCEKMCCLKKSKLLHHEEMKARERFGDL